MGGPQKRWKQTTLSKLRHSPGEVQQKQTPLKTGTKGTLQLPGLQEEVRANTLAAFEDDANWAGDWSFLDKIDKENHDPNKTMPNDNESDLQGLDLRAQFKSEEDMLQYIAGFWEADGGMVMMNGSLRLYFHQSNRVFLKALKAEYGASGVYCELPENDGTVEWGKYSNGELPQRLRYDNADAIRVLNTFAPYVVSKLYHISLAEEWQTLHASPASPARTKALQLLQASISAANHGIGAIPPATQSITAAWLGGLFDGDGSVTVNINKSPRRAMRGLLTLAVGQPKCVALLPAIQKKFGGNSFTGSCEVRWESRKSLPPIFEVLYPHIVMKRQKLRCLLKNMFDVNLEARPIEGKGNAGAFSCVPPSREWTASKWREYLGTETLLPWSR